MKRVVLLIGGNLGDRLQLLKQAEDLLKKKFTVVKKSYIYESVAWGDNSEGDYLNRILIIETDMDPEEILRQAQAIEDLLERVRIQKWGNRTMDIDILYVDEQIIQSPTLTVPHPFIQERRFVLVPLCELLPAFRHPILNKTHLQLLKICRDEGEVKVYEEN